MSVYAANPELTDRVDPVEQYPTAFSREIGALAEQDQEGMMSGALVLQNPNQIAFDRDNEKNNEQDQDANYSLLSPPIQVQDHPQHGAR